VNDSIPLLAAALNFYHQKMNTIHYQLLNLSKKKGKYIKVQTKMTSRLNQLNNYNSNNNFKPSPVQPPIHKIEITVSAKEATSGRLKVSYLVSNAGWIPLYDLRSKSSDNTINLTYKAQVYQHTGVEWKNIKLSLSTNNPYTNKTKPELHPWYLNYAAINQQYKDNTDDLSEIQYEKKRDLKSIAIRETNTSASKIETVEENVALNANQFTTLIEQLISVEYAIDLPYTIESTNEKHMVLVDSKSLNTKYKYYSVPKLELSCYLVTQITNLDNLNLIPGNATIFHDGAYLGVTHLNPSIMSDTMNLSLGKEQKIQIKHTLLKNETKEKTIGDKIHKTYAYQMEFKNHKNSTIKITVQDQIPITQNTEIDIELINGSKGKLNETTGIIEWELKLKPKETKKLKLVYSIKHSKSTPVNLTLL
jgi:uncharacterized protein (TIGR02231 family)